MSQTSLHVQPISAIPSGVPVMVVSMSSLPECEALPAQWRSSGPFGVNGEPLSSWEIDRNLCADSAHVLGLYGVWSRVVGPAAPPLKMSIPNGLLSSQSSLLVETR